MCNADCTRHKSCYVVHVTGFYQFIILLKISTYMENCFLPKKYFGYFAYQSKQTFFGNAILIDSVEHLTVISIHDAIAN